jgi:UDP-N-acetylmuramoylalanine--D-glutamate ligase
MTAALMTDAHTTHSLAGTHALVVGLGREGRDLASFLALSGARVRVTDTRPADTLTDTMATLADLPIEYSLAGHPLSDLDASEVVYVSPGVRPEIPLLAEARRRGIRLSSATELFFQLCPGTIVGVTGSSGKSTTSAMAGSILRCAGRHTLVGGNIGVPMLGRLDELTADSWVVMELSSFQLEFMRRSPSIAVVTNVTPNHLDRHPSMDAYREAKAQILNHQTETDWAVLNLDDPESARLQHRGRCLHFSLVQPTHGAFRDGRALMLHTGESRIALLQQPELRLRGEHNAANALAAAAASAAAGVNSNDIRQGLLQFEALPHRIEPVGVVDGAAYYNDSIATSPERSIAAMLSFSEPIVLLAGGRDKHLPMERWAELMLERARWLVVFGEAADLIAGAARSAGYPTGHIIPVETLTSAVEAARQVAQPGDALLLSPGCTSYDAFTDFEARGDRFRELVRAMEAARP